MKMRQHKQIIMARQLALWLPIRLGMQLLARSAAREIEATHAQRQAEVSQLFKDIGLGVFADAPVKAQFICERVKDGNAVGTFDTREEALALLRKHDKQKKAKLQVRNSVTNALEVFTTDEMFA